MFHFLFRRNNVVLHISFFLLLIAGIMLYFMFRFLLLIAGVILHFMFRFLFTMIAGIMFDVHVTVSVSILSVICSSSGPIRPDELLSW